MQFRTVSIKYEKTSITKSKNLVDVALKFAWGYTDGSLPNAFELSFASSPVLLYFIETIVQVLNV